MGMRTAKVMVMVSLMKMGMRTTKVMVMVSLMKTGVFLVARIFSFVMINSIVFC